MNQDRPYYKCPNIAYDIEVKDILEAWFFNKNFYLANVLKYIFRIKKSKNKRTRIEDLKKARTYLNYEIELLEKELQNV